MFFTFRLTVIAFLFTHISFASAELAPQENSLFSGQNLSCSGCDRGGRDRDRDRNNDRERDN